MPEPQHNGPHRTPAVAPVPDLCHHCDAATWIAQPHPCCAWWAVHGHPDDCPACGESRRHAAARAIRTSRRAA